LTFILLTNFKRFLLNISVAFTTFQYCRVEHRRQLLPVHVLLPEQILEIPSRTAAMPGTQLQAEVPLGHVVVVFGVAVSRLVEVIYK
jgi:hypothetical protein